MHTYYSANELFTIKDNNAPIAVMQAIKGLLKPFESLFPDSRVPGNEQEALEYITTPEKYRPSQPFSPEMKRDWIYMLWCEIQMRLEAVFRFVTLCSTVTRKRRWWRKTKPIILFLREFRKIEYEVELGMHISTGAESDFMLRTKIEQMFPNCSVLWIANPKDDLCRSFVDANWPVALDRINRNSIPYIASGDWLECVRILAEASDLIVMSNLKSDGGVGREVAMLVECGLVHKAFFSHPDLVGLPLGQLNNISDLRPRRLKAADDARHRKVLELPPMRHWAGAESMGYASNYIAAANNCAGNLRDLGGNVNREVFAAVFLALVALLIFRAELKAAGTLQRSVAEVLLAQPEQCHASDVAAAELLYEIAEWYVAYGDNYCMAHLIAMFTR